MRMTKFIFTVCIILLIVMFANGAYILSEPGKSMNIKKPVPLNEYKEGTGQAREFEQLESSASELSPVNILVMGLDKDETRSDVILLFNFDPAASKLNILSIARDTRVIADGKYSKINALYAKGRERRLAEEAAKITGLPVHYYITMNIKGFRKIVDTLGGVKFYVPFAMNYDDPTQDLHIHLKKGMQTLNGSKAEQLVRYRKGNRKGQGYDEGDIGRIKMQQDFLKALIEQKVNFRYLSRADEIFDILGRYVKTNITFSDIAQYMGNIIKVGGDEIKTFTLPGESSYLNEVWYFIHYRRQTAELIEKNFFK